MSVHEGVSPRARRILDLDDHCLLKILENLDPLPDRFNAAASCKVHVSRCLCLRCSVTTKPRDSGRSDTPVHAEVLQRH